MDMAFHVEQGDSWHLRLGGSDYTVLATTRNPEASMSGSKIPRASTVASTANGIIISA
jgi:hypothetical protein